MGLSREARFEAVYRDCLRDVKSFAWARVGRADGDDVVNATFMTVWVRLDDMPRDSTRAWVLGVCRNHCRKRWRSNRRFDALIDQMRASRPQLEAALVAGGIPVDSFLTLTAAVEGLGAADRELFVLAVFSELTPDEIGRVLGVPAPTIRVRLHRLRKELARHLADGDAEVTAQ